jgi:hypothetical protein
VWRCLIFISLVVVFIQSCNPTDQTAIETAPTTNKTQSSLAVSLIPSEQEIVNGCSHTPATMLTASTPIEQVIPIYPSATPSLTTCLKAGGRVTFDNFIINLLSEPLNDNIYLPPCYDEEADRYYPVLYLVPGKNATTSQ